ncbi:MAG: signal peptidase I, partial [Clostridia bacterium]|nr:signal peptidase I [Clostridia bacterium]
MNDTVTPANTQPDKPEKQTLVTTLFEYLEIFVYSALIVVLLFTFATRLTRVVGPSMEDTLIQGEGLLVSNLFYEPEPGDIIVFHELGAYNEPIVKRVIATEGQVVDIDFATWTVKVDGEVIDESYRKLTYDTLN